MSRRLLSWHQRTSVVALALLLLWAVGWGQVHRVLHSAGPSVAVGNALDKVFSHPAGDEDGRAQCQLLDDLTQGVGPLHVLPTWLCLWLPVVVAGVCRIGAHAIEWRRFDARGPPGLA